MRRRSVRDSPGLRLPEDPPRVRSLPQFLSVPNLTRPLIPLPRMKIDSPSRFVLTLFCFLIRAPVEVFEAARVERMLQSADVDAESISCRPSPSGTGARCRFCSGSTPASSGSFPWSPPEAHRAQRLPHSSQTPASAYAPEPLQRWM